KRLCGFQIEALTWAGFSISGSAGLAPRRGSYPLEREGHGDDANAGGRRLPDRAVSSARDRPGPHRRRPISAERLAGLGSRLSRTSRLVDPGIAAVMIAPERRESLRVFGRLPVTGQGVSRRQASEKPRGRKPRGEFAPTL